MSRPRAPHEGIRAGGISGEAGPVLAFFLYHFNDVDHIGPVMWKLLQRGYQVKATLLNPAYDSDSDPRLKLLLKFPHFQLRNIQDRLPIPGVRWLFQTDLLPPGSKIQTVLRLLLRKSGLSVRMVRRALRQMAPDICVFEWGAPSTRNRAEFFDAASQLGIPTVCLPHGLNIYTNIDVSPQMREIVATQKPIRASLNRYAAYVYQTQYHLDQDVSLGINPNICHVLGSARYFPEWQAINQGFNPPFVPQQEARDRLKVVFMLPHWHYNTDPDACLDLFAEIARQDWIRLVLKEHTRGSGSFTHKMRDALKGSNSPEVTDSASSVSLIQWADVVISFASSIAIEVLLQDKVLIHPSFLHTNHTIFEETGACYEAKSAASVLTTLRQAKDLSLTTIPEDKKRELFHQVVYGGQLPHDVLGAYVEFLLVEIARNQESRRR